MELITCAVRGKHDDPSRCEDVVALHERAVVVADGVSSDGTVTLAAGTVTTSGRAAAERIAATVTGLADAGALPPPRDLVDAATAAVADLPSSPAGRRAGAAVTVLDLAANRIVRVGDGPFRVNGTVYGGRSAIDQVTVATRCAYLHALLEGGATPQELAASDPDPGREMILPLLTVQHALSNRQGPYGFAAVNGTVVHGSFIEVVELPPGAWHVVLATDGYPDISGTFAQAEADLARRLVEDPLCIGVLAGTKPVRPGQVSFDDRAWVELRR